MIRVIGGRFKGRRLSLVRSPLVRPLPAKLKATLFNIIQDEVKAAVVLDGFAGTGSFGLEALSRGAEFVVFVDEQLPSVKAVKINLARCGAEDRGRVLYKEFNRAVIQLAREESLFDIIFLDPPYRMLEERNPLKVIKKRGILKPGGLIVLRHHHKIAPDRKFFEPARTVASGDDRLTFYR